MSLNWQWKEKRGYEKGEEISSNVDYLQDAVSTLNDIIDELECM